MHVPIREMQSVLFTVSSVRELSQDVPANASFLCDRAAVLGDTIERTLCLKPVTSCCV